jgi:hypothetical protein
MTSRICPNPKIGSYMFLGLFIVAELIGFVRASLQDLRLRILFTGGGLTWVCWSAFGISKYPRRPKLLKRSANSCHPALIRIHLGQSRDNAM